LVNGGGGAYAPRPARREAKVAGEEGLAAVAVTVGGGPVGAGEAAPRMLLTTAGEPGPRSMRLSSVASLRTWRRRTDEKHSGFNPFVGV